MKLVLHKMITFFFCSVNIDFYQVAIYCHLLSAFPLLLQDSSADGHQQKISMALSPSIAPPGSLFLTKRKKNHQLPAVSLIENIV